MADDEKVPALHKRGTLYVTQQFRYFNDCYHIVQSIGEPGQFGLAYECYLKSVESILARVALSSIDCICR